jgi:hypothetical protein
MARLGKLRPTPVALGLAMFDLWKRMSPQQRKQVVNIVREHGPSVVSKAAKLSRRRRWQ